ncbi:MAG TPA: site-specific integrase, partial [Candidatus Methylomirabilis sp.]|nr:site-specific integrase [Candidatus Methylomirabilis sp.]
MVSNAVSSPITKRLYSFALDQFCGWYFSEPREPMSKAVLQQYRASLEERAYAPATIRLHLAALRRLVVEAADNGLIDPSIAAAILRVRGPRTHGRRIGKWLTLQQSSELLNRPDGSLRGKRDRAILGLLMGCGLRRAEICSLQTTHLQLREERWVIADLKSKQGRVRTVPLPSPVILLVQEWITASGIGPGPLFWAINKAGRLTRAGLTAQAVYDIVKNRAWHCDPGIAPHDLRRTFAKLAFAADPRLDQVQVVLGHASVKTTEAYLGLSQDLKNSPGDRIAFCLQGRSDDTREQD